MSNHEIPTPCLLFLDVVSIRLLFRSTIEYNEDHIGTIRKTRGSSVRGIYSVQREELTRTWHKQESTHGLARSRWRVLAQTQKSKEDADWPGHEAAGGDSPCQRYHPTKHTEVCSPS